MKQTRLFRAWLLLVLLALASSFSATRARAETTAAATTRPTTAPIIVLHGDAASIGTAHGKALAEAIRQMHTAFFDKALQGVDRSILVAGAMDFEPQLRPEHLAEIKALSAAASVEESQIMLANSFLDLEPMQGCSTITLPAEASPDHVARFARNLDFPGYGALDRSSVVLVYKPNDGRYGFVTIGWPGLIGAFSGMNEHGLAVANMEVDRPAGGTPHGMPYALLYRTLLERCKTTDEAIDLLKKTPRQTANNLMIMDAAGNRAVVELTPDAVVVRSGQPGIALISTNHQRGEDADTPGKCDRYDYLHDTAQASLGKLDRDAIVSMLKHVQQDEMTIQSMIFEPSNRVLYLATGAHAAEQDFQKIELAGYFQH